MLKIIIGTDTFLGIVVSFVNPYHPAASVSFHVCVHMGAIVMVMV